jgi:hydrogenase expression/formation protein HypD
MLALLKSGDVPLDGFICPGHVSVIIGAEAYQPIVERFGKPCVVAGFEPQQLLIGILALLKLIIKDRAAVDNVYRNVASAEGNRVALSLLQQVFVRADTPWRAIGVIPESGLELASAYRKFDALERLGVTLGEDDENPACRCGEVIQGKVDPKDCSLFGNGCTPLHPIGPCMVSSEGTCAAWYKYNRARQTRVNQGEVPT